MNIIQKITTATALAMGIALPVSSMAQTTMDHSKMDMSQPAASMTEGEVKKIDLEAGKVTIKHGPIKHMDMPGMGRVEGPAQKANAAAAAIAKAGWDHGGSINRSGAKVNWPAMAHQPVTCTQRQRRSGLFWGIHLFPPNNPDYASIRACRRAAAADAYRASDSLD